MVLYMGGKHSGLLGKNLNVLREQRSQEHKSGPGPMPETGVQVTVYKGNSSDQNLIRLQGEPSENHRKYI